MPNYKPHIPSLVNVTIGQQFQIICYLSKLALLVHLQQLLNLINSGHNLNNEKTLDLTIHKFFKENLHDIKNNVYYNMQEYLSFSGNSLNLPETMILRIYCTNCI